MPDPPADPDPGPLARARTVVDLLETPALARVYSHCVRDGPETVAAIVDEAGVPQGTAYDYVARLERAGFLERITDERPHEYAAVPVSLAVSSDGTTRRITPALVAAVARRADDADLDVYLDRHGLDGLAVALEYAFAADEGAADHRDLARARDLSPLEAELVLGALRPVAREFGPLTD